MIKRQILFAIKCKLCCNEFVYCAVSGGDSRCYECKNGTSVKEVEAELESMSEEERKSFEEDIKEYEQEYGKIDEL